MSRNHTNTPQRQRRRSSLLPAIAATILVLTAGVATAAATTRIEGVWSFNGGQIAIQPEGNGKFEGVVVAPTKFAACVHPTGQKIWKEITPLADGSFQGFHEWFKSTESGEECTPNPTFGPTAWRVIEEPGGSRYLRVCLSRPGTEQPTIPAGSAGVGATYGCVSSALIAPLPETTGNGNGAGGGSGSTGNPGNPGTGKSGTGAYKETLSLPSAKKCLSARLFQIHLQDPKYDPFKTVVVTIKGKKLKTTRHGTFIVATVNLKGFPHGRFTIKIVATTVLGHHLSGSRTYHTCAKKAKASKPKKLS
jgi:hypothetical protein